MKFLSLKSKHNTRKCSFQSTINSKICAHQLLLLGVGPESYLSSLGIPVVIDHPYVGHFLYGNPRNFINILPPNPLEGSIVTALGIRNNFWQCSISGGPLTVPPYGFFPVSVLPPTKFNFRSHS